MLAPLRDYLRPEDPRLSSLLCAAREGYFTRMSVDTAPDRRRRREARWITSEDVNVEHLLDVFTTIGTSSKRDWDACANFIRLLIHQKPRATILRAKIEALPDHHHSKLRCLSNLAQLSESFGNYGESMRLLISTLGLWRERGSDHEIAQALRSLSGANGRLGFYKEGIQMAKEALEILERLGKTGPQGRCLANLAWLCHDDDQLDAAEEAASRAMDLFSKEGDQDWVCKTHSLLGAIYRSKGETEKAIHHLEIALGLASSSDWHNQLHRIHSVLAELFLDGGRFDRAQAHVEHAKTYAFNHSYYLGEATTLQAKLWYRQGRFEEARSEALRAIDAHERLGAARPLERCRELLQEIERNIT